ncbi:MAG: ribonuclease D [Symploca sp. SIO3C6]|uniref:Ribonuclease D n=1 Tax=Symploca sp. SIO1C4 TaxID=2607765 RepID=A0A6B3N4K7_9CYAN|nr:ribonuclease D [Symploca sp. SIO3C6]NER26507.1 ribonuclease D [Symploca sp. SIO1C4]NET07525.1 ribonuclease D [Symploca sp. SIO2B6]
MQYLTGFKDIQAVISKYSQTKILWIDTEIADYQTSKPRLSLIQVLDKPTQMGIDAAETERVSILDVLEKSEIIDEFIEKIIFNPDIEKVFHNASYDLRFLGNRQAQNVSCTLEMAKSIPYYLLPVPNFKLETLAEQLCHLSAVDKTQQGSDWGIRPLSRKQLHYAKMDPVYLARVHHRLLQLKQLANPDPVKEDLSALMIRYRQLEHQWKQIDTEINHIKNRIKAAMAAQEVSETAGFKLSSSKRTTKKAAFEQLAKLTQTLGIELDLPVTLTKAVQKQLGEAIEQLSLEEEVSTNWRLSIQELEDEDLPF